MSTREALSPIDTVIARISRVYGGWSRATPLAQMRQDWDILMGREMPAAQIESTTAGGVPAQWISAPGVRADKAVLYFHGGGFQLGSLLSHRELMVNISAASGCRVLGVDYRLAPEHRYPAPLEDARAAYVWLLAQSLQGTDIALAGDSAGGGLALSLMLSLRDAGLPLPAAAVVMSPWTDLSASGASYVTRAAADPIHQRAMVLAMARNYLGKDPLGNPRDPCEPLASPLFGNLRGLPPLLIQVGDRETVLSDATEFAAKAQAAGGDVKLEEWPGMVHVFQQFATELPEARAAIASLGHFLNIHLNNH